MKIEASSPWWKKPAWWWTTGFNAWPFSAEWLSAVFDYNVAPFFQSFVEVKVEPSAGRVRVVPCARERAADMEGSQCVGQPAAASVAEPEWVEWTIPMTR